MSDERAAPKRERVNEERPNQGKGREGSKALQEVHSQSLSTRVSALACLSAPASCASSLRSALVPGGDGAERVHAHRDDHDRPRVRWPQLPEVRSPAPRLKPCSLLRSIVRHNRCCSSVQRPLAKEGERWQCAKTNKKGAVRQGLAEVTKIGGLVFLTGETACVSSESSN